MDRKHFIKTCGMACLGTSSLVLMLEGCTATNYFAQTKNINDKMVIAKSEFIGLTGKGKVVNRKFVLIRNPQYNYPICIFKISDDEYFALLTQCTHNGCELIPQGDYLTCPCHGSEFNYKGQVQNPPAERDLQVFNVTTDHENIFIHL